MLHSQLELLAPLGNNNHLKIAYAWEGFRYSQDFKRVQGVVGAIEVGVMFKLDSHPVIKDENYKWRESSKSGWGIPRT